MQPASEPVRPKSVVCIGAFCIDMVCAVQEPVQTGQAVCCSHFSRTLGGKGLNQTVALRQGGLNPHFYAKAGWAEYGLLCSFLKNRGIAADGIYPMAGESNTGILQITPSGDTAILGCANPETAFSEQEVCSILGRYAREIGCSSRMKYLELRELFRQQKAWPERCPQSVANQRSL